MNLFECPACLDDATTCPTHATHPISALAEDLVAHLLAGLPVRLAHSRGVARAMRTLTSRPMGPVHGHFCDVAYALGLLHDIGYSTPVTGHHAIDGAALLDGTELAPLAPYVAWHSTAAEEAVIRGLSIDWPRPTGFLADALWIADFTTDTHGRPCTLADRLTGIRSRYQPDSPVIAALDASLPALEQTQERLRGIPGDQGRF